MSVCQSILEDWPTDIQALETDIRCLSESTLYVGELTRRRALLRVL